ncbi:MAG: hypothetical protein IJY47_07530 [Clostridia bacterium]|nr:hypothetical protein [Clostridia bacterium]
MAKKTFSRRSPLKIPLRPRRFMRRGGFAMKQVSPEGSYDHLRVVGLGDCGCYRR